MPMVMYAWRTVWQQLSVTDYKQEWAREISNGTLALGFRSIANQFKFIADNIDYS